MQNQETFRKWLIETNRKKNGDALNESTVNCYVRTIDNLSDDMMQLRVIDKSLYNALDYLELDRMVNKIINNSDFINKNIKGHNRHSCALDHYIDFVHNSN